MKKVVLIPDSFKGTMSSSEICRIMSKQIHALSPDTEIISIPVADGGEGSVDAFLQAEGGKKVFMAVSGPYGEKVDGYFGIIRDTTAVIEMAACAGFSMAGDRNRPDIATTYGVGQLIKEAAKKCSKIIVGLGGSCTNDGGAGAAAAAGVKFFDDDGAEFVPTGGTLSKICSIDMSGIDENVKKAEIIAMCDTDIPLFGRYGAAYIFGPQKGADAGMLEILDKGLRDFAKTIDKELHVDISNIPGAGAAGGMGGGIAAFFGAKLQRGIETVLDTVHFDSVAKDADMVFSGEGRLDFQSLHGKVIEGVARHTKKLGIPLVVIVGDIGDNIEGIYDCGVSAIFSINRKAIVLSKAKERSRSDLALTVDNLMRFFNIIGL